MFFRIMPFIHMLPVSSAGTHMNPDSINVIVGYTTRDTTVDYDPVNNYPVYILVVQYVLF